MEMITGIELRCWQIRRDLKSWKYSPQKPIGKYHRDTYRTMEL